MSQTAQTHDPNKLGRAAEPNPDGPAPKRVVVSYGFWIFLLSDIIMFSAFFAAYAVLSGQTAGQAATPEQAQEKRIEKVTTRPRTESAAEALVDDAATHGLGG